LKKDQKLQIWYQNSQTGNPAAKPLKWADFSSSTFANGCEFRASKWKI